MKILLVDDDKINNKKLTKQLEKRGYEAIQAFCGTECLEILERDKIDLILLDIMMPDISGKEVLSILRKKYTAIELPIIMVTGKSETEDIVECLKAGASDYIVKPVNIDVAIARISTQEKIMQLDSESSQKAELEAAQAMIATYNHEINNPLTIAIGLLYQIKGEGDQINVEKISTALYRIVDIVKKIEMINEKTELKKAEYTKTDEMVKLEG